MTRKNKPSQRPQSILKVLVVCLLVVFMAGFVSAWEFDNVKDYDPVTREVTITNAFGWGDVIAKATLETPLNVMVPRGVDIQVGIFNIVAEEDGSNILGALDLVDLKNGNNWNTRGKQLKVETFKEIRVDDYKTVCEDIVLGNGTIKEDCNKIEVGNHLETVTEWKPIKETTEFLRGVKYRIGIYVDVEEGDRGDWRFYFYGKLVDEWAEWTEDIEISLLLWYKLDETSGTNVYDSVGNYNGTNEGGMTLGETGILGTAYGSEESTNNITIPMSSTSGDYSFSFWLNPTQTEIAQSRFFESSNQFFIISSNQSLDGIGGDIAYYDGAWRDFETPVVNGVLKHYVMTFDTGTGKGYLYINGVLQATTPTYVSKNLGGTVNIGETYRGIVDEFGLWERVLNQSEVTQLYNGGVGITFPGGDTDTNPNITLNSPSTANYTTEQTPTINFTASDDINLSSVKLYVNEVLNQTNATGVNNSIYLFDLVLSDGDYTIYGTATDNESQATNSTSITIGIDSIAPVLNITNNTDEYTYTLPINKSLNMSVVDLHIDTCIYWTSDNSTNNTITCNTPTNVTFATGGEKIIYTWVNDTYGLTATAQDNFFINYLQDNIVYDAVVLAQDSQTLYLNVTATNITTYNVNFTYNGTANTPTVSSNGTLLQAYVTLTNPEASVNLINWTYTINAFTNSTAVNQTVKDLTALIVQAGACDDLAVKFVLQDEANATNLTGTISYNIKYGPSSATSNIMEAYGVVTNSSINLCINATESASYYIGYGELQYTVTGYVDRRYYMFEDSQISNATYEVKFLRELETTEQTSFLLTLQDSDLNVYANKYTALWRWYPDLNAYKIVEMGKTDEDGQTVAHVRTEDVDYRTALYHLNGTLIKFDSPRRFLCTASPCSLDIVVGDDGGDLTAFFDIEQSLTYNSTTGIITYIFNDPNQLTQSMRLKVEKIHPTNEVTLCDTTATGYTGVITCNISIYSGTFKATAYRTASPEVPIAQKLINTADTLFKSSFGLFFSVIIWLAIVLTGFVGGPILTVILAIVGLLPALFLGSINLAIFTGFAVLGAIILHFIKRSAL